MEQTSTCNSHKITVFAMVNSTQDSIKTKPVLEMQGIKKTGSSLLTMLNK
jgi:hypothetical protein